MFMLLFFDTTSLNFPHVSETLYLDFDYEHIAYLIFTSKDPYMGSGCEMFKPVIIEGKGENSKFYSE